MNTLDFQPAIALIQTSKSPLISIPKKPSTDALAAALGLFLVCEKLGKAAKIVSPEFSLAPEHAFLPNSQNVQQELKNLRNFVISVDTSRAKLGSLSYDLQGNQLHIYLNPKQGQFEQQDITLSSGPFAHDVILTLDLTNLDQLGSLYEQNVEFFAHTPTINIDHHPANTRFGQVPLVDVVANSVSEIVFAMIQTLDPELFSEQLATTLLAGIMSKTKGFQSQTVTPRSLAVASHLVAAGAHRDEIVRNLYQTKSLNTLKLWGRALTKLQASDDHTTVWTSLTTQDLQELGVQADQAYGVLDELITNTPEATYYLLLIASPQHVDVALLHPAHHSLPKLPAELTEYSAEQLRGRIPGQVSTVVETLVAALSQPTKQPGR